VFIRHHREHWLGQGKGHARRAQPD
jgi:hypothetical protein